MITYYILHILHMSEIVRDGIRKEVGKESREM